MSPETLETTASNHKKMIMIAVYERESSAVLFDGRFKALDTFLEPTA